MSRAIKNYIALAKRGCFNWITMAFDKEELQQLRDLLNDQHSVVMLDAKILLQQELRPLREDLELLKERMDQLFKMASEDVGVAYQEIESLKRSVNKLEKRIVALERR